MDPEVETLAKSLKNSGLAASMEDAIKKAEDVLSGKNKGQNIRAKTKFDKPGFDIAKEERPLKEVVEEAEKGAEETDEAREEPEENVEEEKEGAEEEKEEEEEKTEEQQEEKEEEEKEKISVEELEEEPIEEQPEEEK